MRKYNGPEKFKSKFGTIYVHGYDYCEGCPTFKPKVHRVQIGTKTGKYDFDKYGQLITNDLSVECEYQFSCPWIAIELAERLKKENTK